MFLWGRKTAHYVNFSMMTLVIAMAVPYQMRLAKVGVGGPRMEELSARLIVGNGHYGTNVTLTQIAPPSTSPPVPKSHFCAVCSRRTQRKTRR